MLKIFGASFSLVELGFYTCLGILAIAFVLRLVYSHIWDRAHMAGNNILKEKLRKLEKVSTAFLMAGCIPGLLGLIGVEIWLFAQGWRSIVDVLCSILFVAFVVNFWLIPTPTPSPKPIKIN